MIDLRSDTVTEPGEEMREAARTAAVGDDVYGEDPTANELEDRAADRLGMDAALFVPTGTMGNQVAAHVHTEPGQEVLADRESHVVRYELGGLAQHAGLQVRMLDAGPRGVPSPEQVATGYVEEDPHRPGTGLLCLENTHNVRGGLAIDPDRIAAAAEAAHDRGVPVHLDGARLWNASVALDVPVADFTAPVDSVMVSLSKGLGAPIGSILAGDRAFVDRARRTRKLFGGGMRQVGVVAAPGLRALENVDDLATDHEHARTLAAGLDDVPGLSVREPETNVVLVDVDDGGRDVGDGRSDAGDGGGDGDVGDVDARSGEADDVLDAETVLDELRERGVLGTAFGPSTIRLCTHRDVDESEIDAALERANAALS